MHGEQLGTALSDKLQKNLTSDLKNLAMTFKNTAYTEGFQDGLQSVKIKLNDLFE